MTYANPIQHASVISCSELQKRNKDRLILLDCRFSLQDKRLGARLYAEGHLPGAYYCHLERDLSAPVTLHSGRHPLPDPYQFAKNLAQWGITPLSTVVVYDDNRLGFAARAWWLLRQAGVADVRILNGGFSAWQAAHYPLDRREAKLKLPPSRMTHRLSWSGIIDCEELSQWLHDKPDLYLIDSREPARYRGEHEPIDPVAGHIDGAHNHPWQNITDDEGFIRPLEDQQHLWQSLADTDLPVVYCGSGVTACVNLFSLHLIGRTGAILYPGSWSQWCSYNLSSQKAGG